MPEINTIEKNIPVPSRTGRRRVYAAVYDLEVGDSTVYPATSCSSLRPTVQYIQRMHGKRFTRRTEGNMVRIWRTA